VTRKRTAHCYALRSLPLAVAGLLGACDQQAGPVCTALFAVATVTVVDSLQAPATTATVTTTLLRTGETLTPTTIMDFALGVYPILDDGARSKLRTSGDSIRVRVVQGAAAAETVYRIDVPGGCHVERVGGPDTLVLH
jgi:hypothetical protein